MKYSKYLSLLICLMMSLSIWSIEYGDYLELNYEAQGIKLIKSDATDIVLDWNKQKEPRINDIIKVLIALPNENYTLDIESYHADIYYKEEKVHSITKEDDSSYNKAFQDQLKNIVKQSHFGYLRLVYPLAVKIIPYRNLYAKDINRHFTMKLSDIRIRIHCNDPITENSNLQESENMQRIYSAMFLNADMISLYYNQPSDTDSYSYEEPTWTPSSDPDTKYIRITILQKGLQRVAGFEILPLLKDFEILNPNHFILKYKGKNVPFKITGRKDNRFDPEDILIFYGDGIEEQNIYTDTGEYWLGYNETHRGYPVQDIKPLRMKMSALKPYQMVLKTRKFEGEYDWEPSLNIEDGWWWLKIEKNKKLGIDFQIPDLVSSAPKRSLKNHPCQMKVHLAYDGVKDLLGILGDKVYVNGHHIALTIENIYQGYIQFDLPYKYLKKGHNKVSFQLVNSKIPLYIDRFFVTYYSTVSSDNYQDFQTYWRGRMFEYTNQGKEVFLFNQENQKFYQSIESGAENSYYQPLKQELANKNIEKLQIHATSYTWRIPDAFSQLYIDDQSWIFHKQGILLIKYDTVSKECSLLHRIPHHTVYKDYKKIEKDFYKIIKAQKDHEIFFCLSNGRYNNPNHGRFFRSIAYKLGIKTAQKTYYGKPFAIVAVKENGKYASSLFYPKKPHSFQDDLFVSMKGIGQKKGPGKLHFVRKFTGEENLILCDASGLKKCMFGAYDDCGLRNKEQFDYLIVSHEKFLKTLKPYISFLEKNKGYKVKLINVQTIYDEFSDGYHSPLAINQYLRYAFRNYKAPLPLYMLLVGDATWDYRRYYDTEVYSLVPSYHSVDKPKKYCVEDFFSRVSDDRLNDLIMGRWPCNNTRQLKNIMDKSMAYQTMSFDYSDLEWLNRLGFVVDDGYENEAKNATASGMPNDFFVDPVYLKNYPLQDNRMYPLKNRRKRSVLATNAVLESINKGHSMMFYMGHGGPNVLSHERLLLGGGTPHSDGYHFKNKDKYFFLIVMSCLNGLFDYHNPPWNVSIVEDYLFRKDSGIIGGLAPAGKGIIQWHQELAKYIFNYMFSPRSMTFGESIFAGKSTYMLNDGHIQTAEMFAYMGDPSIDPIYPKLRSSIELDPITPGLSFGVKGDILQVASDNLRKIEYENVSEFTGQGKLIIYTLENEELYRQENVDVIDGKWSLEAFLPELEMDKLIFRVLFVNTAGNKVALGQNLANGYREISVNAIEKDAKAAVKDDETADVKIVDVDYSADEFIEGNSIFFRVKTKNYSDKTFTNVRMESEFSTDPESMALDSDERKWTRLRTLSSWKSYKNLKYKPGEEITLYFKYDPKTKPGLCDFKFMIRNNHTKATQIVYRKASYTKRADLEVTKVSFIEMVKQSTTDCRFSVKIKNDGGTNAENFAVSFKANGQSVCEDLIVPILLPMEEKEFVINGRLRKSSGAIELVLDHGFGNEGNALNGRVFEHLEPAKSIQKNNKVSIQYDLTKKTMELK